MGPGAHGLVTTPGATRFYRSTGERALQRTHLTLAEGARLEWLPLEALCYNACNAENHLTLNLAPGAECMGWDVTALGLPHAGQPFETGRFVQHIEAPGRWLERGVIDAQDGAAFDEAYQFINFLLQPKVIAPISDKTGYPNPNKEGIGLVKSLSDIGAIVLKEVGGTPVFVRDVAEVTFGHEVRQGAVVKNGVTESVGGVVMMLRGGNAKEVVSRDRKSVV